MARTLIRYKTYNFRDKDPIIDRLKTAYQDARRNDPVLSRGGFAEIHRRSGMSAATPKNWFDGETRRPNFASVAAFARSIGCDLALVKRNAAGVERAFRVMGKPSLSVVVSGPSPIRRRA